MNPEEPLPSPGPNVGARPPGSCWTPERLELKAWLDRNAPSLAELYEGAVCLLFEHRLAGYTRLIAHIVREIRNRLPFVISGSSSSGRLEYPDRLSEITEQWRKANLDVGSSFQSLGATPSSVGPSPPAVAIPLDLFRLLEKLIADHEVTSEKAADAFARLLVGRKPENQKFIKTLQPVISQWLHVTGWFVSKAHDSGRVDAAIDNRELLKNFELFETTLFAIVRQFFATTAELDQILKEANSSCVRPTSEQLQDAVGRPWRTSPVLL